MNDDTASIPPDARPRLPRGVRLVENETHGWTLLGPERVIKADPIAVEIIKRCTGQATFTEIVDDLAAAFSAPRDRYRDRCDRDVARSRRQAPVGVVTWRERHQCRNRLACWRS